MDTSLVGSVLNALPLDRMIGGPLQSMVKAQIQASNQYAQFLMSVCIKDGKAKNVQFEYDETLVDREGNFKGVHKKTMRIPLLAAITHPNICIEEGTIDFDLEVSQSEEEHHNTEGEASAEGSLGWGPFKVKMSGKVSHKSEQTRKTDTRAKYSIHTGIKRQDPPEAMMRVIDFLTEAATKPIITNEPQILTIEASDDTDSIKTKVSDILGTTKMDIDGFIGNESSSSSTD